MNLAPSLTWLSRSISRFWCFPLRCRESVRSPLTISPAAARAGSLSTPVCVADCDRAPAAFPASPRGSVSLFHKAATGGYRRLRSHFFPLPCLKASKGRPLYLEQNPRFLPRRAGSRPSPLPFRTLPAAWPSCWPGVLEHSGLIATHVSPEAPAAASARSSVTPDLGVVASASLGSHLSVSAARGGGVGSGALFPGALPSPPLLPVLELVQTAFLFSTARHLGVSADCASSPSQCSLREGRDFVLVTAPSRVLGPGWSLTQIVN